MTKFENLISIIFNNILAHIYLFINVLQENMKYDTCIFSQSKLPLDAKISPPTSCQRECSLSWRPLAGELGMAQGRNQTHHLFQRKYANLWGPLTDERSPTIKLKS